MASMHNVPINLNTLVTIKVAIDGTHRKFKVPLRDLGVDELPGKLRLLLNIPSNVDVLFERYSDSAGSFVVLDATDPAIYRQLYRAARAKLKLRLRATVMTASTQAPVADEWAQPEGQGLAPGDAVRPDPPSPSPPHDDARHPDEAASSVVAQDAREPEPRSSHSVVVDTVTPQDVILVREKMVQAFQRSCDADPAATAQRSSVSYAVYCNKCDAPIANEHYHCGICADGDFDLCCDCVDAGHLCEHEDHWLIKRFIKDGRVRNSTTERLAPLKRAAAAAATVEPVRSSTAPRASVDERADPEYEADLTSRTCNSCVEVFPDSNFVHCTVCEDFDLCLRCMARMKHGHHPNHAFRPCTDDIVLDELTRALCAPGRNLRHYALCDGCDKTIVGIRHKCLDCPDWDYCSACVPNAPYIHPDHRFVQVMEPISIRSPRGQHHYGKLCDGPLCNGKPNQRYIIGDRYKCAVCHDTDFCARCEASPINDHNRTHPLIKFRTPVRNVTVSTVHERPGGGEAPVLGDRHAPLPQMVVPSPPPPPAVPAPPVITTAPVRTVVDVKPVVAAAATGASSASSDRCDSGTRGKGDLANGLNAHFVGDAVPDGTKLALNSVFMQIWTIKNPGPAAWPEGCSVRFVGGDNMRNIDMAHPISVAELERSVESTACPVALAPGQSWSFRVILKTPNREGKCISYWRLTAPDGVKFGHKLWCDIEVTRGTLAPAPLEVPVQDPPAYEAVGPSRDASNDSSASMGHDVTSPRPSAGLNANATWVEGSRRLADSVTVKVRQEALRSRIPLGAGVASATDRPHLNASPPMATAPGVAGPAGSSCSGAVEQTPGGSSEDGTQAPLDYQREEAWNSRALVEYQRQLALLEAQNRKRLLPHTERANMMEKSLADVDSKLKFRTKWRSSCGQAFVSEGDRSELPQVEHIEDVDVERKTDTSASGSQSTMIFPKLDKESPVTSQAHVDAVSEPTESGLAADDLISEVESLSLEKDQEEESDESFLTDEEYDILDASDEEFLAVAQKGAQK